MLIMRLTTANVSRIYTIGLLASSITYLAKILTKKLFQKTTAQKYYYCVASFKSISHYIFVLRLGNIKQH